MEKGQPAHPGIYSRIWSQLTEPHVSIDQAEDQRRARLLSALLVITLFIGVLSIPITLLTIDEMPISTRNQLVWVDILAVILILIVYAISRTRYTSIAAVLFIGVVTISAFAAFVQDSRDGFILIYPALGGLLSGLFLSPRVTVIIFGFILSGILLAPFVVADNSAVEIVHPFFFILTVAALVIMAAIIRHRDEEQIKAQSLVLLERDEKMQAAVRSAEIANEQLKSWVTEVEQHSSEISLLSQMGEMLQSCINIQEANGVIREFSNRLFPLSTGAIYMLNASKNFLEALIAWGEAKRELGEQMFSSDECWALRRGRMYSPDPMSQAIFCQHVISAGHSLPFYICIPLMAQGDVLGVYFVATHQSKGALADSQKKLAQSVADQFSLSVANLKLRETLRMQSIRDPLTSLFNRRYL